MPASKGRAWKMERASVSVSGRTRPRSNKYSRADPGQKPAPHSRSKVWVGGYVRTDGRKVSGHYRGV